ncbi:MAG: carbohydrate ABC transporter permease [Rhodospirillales bacterium]
MRKSIFLWAAAAVAVIWTLLPIYWMLKTAFIAPVDAVRFPAPIWPEKPHFAALHNIFGFGYTDPDGREFLPAGQATLVMNGLKNSLIVSAIVTALTLLIIVPLSYAFARFSFKGKTVLLMAILFSVAVPPVSTLIPFFILFVQLGLTGTITGLVIINLTITVPFVTWMLIGYFRNIPAVEPLARIDGFSRLGALVFIVLPMAKSGLMVAAVVSFLFSWNEFVFATQLVNGSPAATLPTAVSGFLFLQPQPGLLSASLWISIIPAAMVAFFLQRHIAEMNIVDPVK